MVNTPLIGSVVLIVVAVLAIVAAIYLRNRRTERLRGRFGPEYDRTVRESASRSRAEADLQKREARVERLRIKPLTADETARFTEAWHRVQTQFVDDPKGAVTAADRLLGEVMSARGYPVSDFDQRAADISVDHPRVVDNYRAGHDIALRHARGQATTEDLRQAMLNYRALFDELVGEAPHPGEHLPHAA
ncbi:hypothetical protein [Geomesophilobacter sediminis]|uniref:Secreted protein n=1 Tax=Geomesophilobacter sediminis TaxID=2798584 RepID=A0A8J7JDL5_9BACT|nr:hypothetical protein [Geomesophilobacter sediminis]MBJ6725258.1 hypothetical protein [Geomesophilobacter sediminis]